MKKSSSSRCKRCNRVLTDPVAQSRGYGIVCWKQHMRDEQKKHSLFNIYGGNNKNK